MYSIGLVLKNALDSRDSAKKVRGLGHIACLIRIRLADRRLVVCCGGSGRYLMYFTCAVG